VSKGKSKQSYISVETLFKENEKGLQLQLLAGQENLKKQITEKDLHRPGLALAG